MSRHEGLMDLAAERAVLAGIYHYGQDAYLDVADIIQQPTSFTDETNEALYKVFAYLFDKRELTKLDQSSVMAAAYELNYSFLFDKPEELAHVKSVFQSQVRLENVRHWAAQIRKLEVARLLRNQLSSAIFDIEKLTGNETVDAIVNIAENAIFDFGELLNLNGSENEPQPIGKGIREYYRHLARNPIDQVGISSGMKYYDDWIGGGFRRKSLSLLGARTGVGKSMISDNVGLHIARHLDIPVLYLDTEMNNEDHWHRLGANLSDITIRTLETGQFGKDMQFMRQVGAAIDILEKIPFDYLNISGKPFEEIISIMRRWVKNKVGVDENGKTKDCLIIYDYVKMMSGEGINAALQEYQMLGFMMTALHNFAVKHDVPIFSLVQLNRDGIDKETTDVVSGSDRIAWLATNIAVFKPKADEEIADDGGLQNGTHKLVVIKARHGGGTPHGDYLNLVMTGDRARIEEGDTRHNLKKKRENKLSTPSKPAPMDEEEVPFSDMSNDDLARQALAAAGAAVPEE